MSGVAVAHDSAHNRSELRSAFTSASSELKVGLADAFGIFDYGLRGAQQLAHPGELGASEFLLAQHFASESDYYDFKARLRHKDGRWVWVHDRGRGATWTPDGKPEWMFGTHLDITAERELARRLAESYTTRWRNGSAWWVADGRSPAGHRTRIDPHRLDDCHRTDP